MAVRSSAGWWRLVCAFQPGGADALHGGQILARDGDIKLPIAVRQHVVFEDENSLRLDLLADVAADATSGHNIGGTTE